MIFHMLEELCLWQEHQDPNSANSQFFICFNNESSYLDRQYTVFGKVIEGMEFVDMIKIGEPASDPDKIISFKSQ